MAKLRKILKKADEDTSAAPDKGLGEGILPETQEQQREDDRTILADEDGSREERIQKAAAKEVESAAEDSLKKLHLIRLGRCPKCGDHLQRHLFASICQSCGWHTFDMPKRGPVRVHLRHGNGVVEGERCYVLKTGQVLVIRGDVVQAEVPRESCGWIEYSWKEEEIDQRHKQVVDRMQISCGWCGKPADPGRDGFHLAHVAFGASQERYCFCSDECYEAFRKMFPARVHRNCYDHNCGDCNLCVKRYGDEAEGVRMLAKDLLHFGK